MEQIYPLREDVISRYNGMLVCVVYKNGLRQIGLLNGCSGGRIELGDNPFEPRPYWSIDPPREQNPLALPPTAEASTAWNPENAGALMKKKTSRKSKPVKAASKRKRKSQSPTYYDSKSQNPALPETSGAAANSQKIALDDIAFLLLLV